MMHMSELEHLILVYLSGELDAAEVQRLSRRLERDSEARRVFWSLARTHACLRRRYHRAHGEASWADPDMAEVLGDLLEYEQRAEVQVRELPPDQQAIYDSDGHGRLAVQPQTPDVPTEQPVALPDRRPRTLLNIGGVQVVRRPASTRANPLRLRWLGWAASIGVVFTLVFTLMQEMGPTSDPAVQVSGNLATLVDEMNAIWRVGDTDELRAFELGDTFEAGEMELIEGFAVIETVNGTRVVLQEATAFELRRGDLLRLERGGIVARTSARTQSFTVLTPTASVTDLGTEFSVEVDEHGSTRSSVFEGIVQFIALDVPAGESFTRLRVQAGYTATVERGRQTLVQATQEVPAADARSVSQPPADRIDYQYSYAQATVEHVEVKENLIEPGVSEFDRPSGVIRNGVTDAVLDEPAATHPNYPHIAYAVDWRELLLYGLDGDDAPQPGLVLDLGGEHELSQITLHKVAGYFGTTVPSRVEVRVDGEHAKTFTDFTDEHFSQATSVATTIDLGGERGSVVELDIYNARGESQGRVGQWTALAEVVVTGVPTD